MYRILIVDDERIERNGIRFLLKKLNMEFDIDEAVNGLDALEKIRQEDYDILLTDVKMPFMDGIELIDNVVNEKKKMRCVIFSGCNEFDYAKRAIRLGVVDYILKPVDPKEFKETLARKLYLAACVGHIEHIPRKRSYLAAICLEIRLAHVSIARHTLIYHNALYVLAVIIICDVDIF